VSIGDDNSQPAVRPWAEDVKTAKKNKAVNDSLRRATKRGELPPVESKGSPNKPMNDALRTAFGYAPPAKPSEDDDD
jgi:hypothetical protein